MYDSPSNDKDVLQLLGLDSVNHSTCSNRADNKV